MAGELSGGTSAGLWSGGPWGAALGYVGGSLLKKAKPLPYDHPGYQALFGQAVNDYYGGGTPAASTGLLGGLAGPHPAPHRQGDTDAIYRAVMAFNQNPNQWTDPSTHQWNLPPELKAVAGVLGREGQAGVQFSPELAQFLQTYQQMDPTSSVGGRQQEAQAQGDWMAKFGVGGTETQAPVFGQPPAIKIDPKEAMVQQYMASGGIFAGNSRDFFYGKGQADPFRKLFSAPSTRM